VVSGLGTAILYTRDEMVSLPLLLGLLIGSFLNVVIARVPEGKSVWSPRSACPGCSRLIAWYDNIPLISFLLLRGRCRACGMAISMRYPLVELATAGAFAGAFAISHSVADFLVNAAFLSALIAITAIDLRHQIIPDVITLPGIAVGFVASVAPGRVSWLDSLIGIAIGGGIFLVIILASRGGMGGGDMKLGAMLGAFLGWQLGLLALLLGILSGGAVAVALLLLGRKGRKEAIPFGPFLALGGCMALLWGDQILTWYLGRF
jgi:leader peptidase (prepilin peptidase) / N-methyltransferase